MGRPARQAFIPGGPAPLLRGYYLEWVRFRPVGRRVGGGGGQGEHSPCQKRPKKRALQNAKCAIERRVNGFCRCLYFPLEAMCVQYIGYTLSDTVCLKHLGLAGDTYRDSLASWILFEHPVKCLYIFFIFFIYVTSHQNYTIVRRTYVLLIAVAPPPTPPPTRVAGQESNRQT